MSATLGRCYHFAPLYHFPFVPLFELSQEAVLPEGAGVVEPDILLAKLRPGQSIELEAHAVKGTPFGTARNWCGDGVQYNASPLHTAPEACVLML